MLWPRGYALSEQEVGDALAQAAVANIVSGMLVGLGAGRTAARGTKALSERVRDDNLDVRCVAASNATEALARDLGLNLVDFAMVEEIDVLIDGADEVDRQMRIMKGSRGAMTRERMLAWASRRRIFMVDQNKVSPKIGTFCSLPIALMAFGLSSTRRAIRELGLNGVLRRDLDGKLFITDNGNLVLDVKLAGVEDLQTLAAELNDLPGVIDHGLFLTEADLILIDHRGQLEVLERR